uniref:Uncharacterized protein n=1 Tax=Chromera velia CCMP2878 TaxID=1169474 RepID=A0A0G4FDE7_9ALVE|eukprot:Cvel_16473.t1-p1 / transcript=Cvel_16473.t1 / gene=Cvel_16473 / organism=Chromera_velia_CCMP2878 / gene_product=DNA double-strand break repair Rad50 ATPase, putative / transcript_product=DNA double-strand break repair Rad50 ATPase, putative / location=Cvel_scaffold1270:3037-11100(+) / protein_length=873 / sequence_SO=supercontig / SO=protein_coding / is_pseudo=false
MQSTIEVVDALAHRIAREGGPGDEAGREREQMALSLPGAGGAGDPDSAAFSLSKLCEIQERELIGIKKQQGISSSLQRKFEEPELANYRTQDQSFSPIFVDAATWASASVLPGTSQRSPYEAPRDTKSLLKNQEPLFSHKALPGGWKPRQASGSLQSSRFNNSAEGASVLKGKFDFERDGEGDTGTNAPEEPQQQGRRPQFGDPVPVPTSLHTQLAAAREAQATFATQARQADSTNAVLRYQLRHAKEKIRELQAQLGKEREHLLVELDRERAAAATLGEAWGQQAGEWRFEAVRQRMDKKRAQAERDEAMQALERERSLATSMVAALKAELQKERSTEKKKQEDLFELKRSLRNAEDKKMEAESMREKVREVAENDVIEARTAVEAWREEAARREKEKDALLTSTELRLLEEKMRLREQCDEEKRKREGVERELEALKAEKERLEAELEAERVQKDSTKKSGLLTNDALLQTRQKLEKAEEEKAALQERVNTLLAEQKALGEALEGNATTVLEIESLKRIVRQMEDHVTEAVRQREEAMMSAEDQLTRVKAELEMLRLKVQDTKAKAEDLQGSAQAVEADRLAKSKVLEERLQAQKNLEEVATDLDQEISNARKELNHWRAQLRFFQDTLKDQNRQKETIQQLAEEMDRLEEGHKQRLDDICRRMAALIHRIPDNMSQKQELNNLALAVQLAAKSARAKQRVSGGTAHPVPAPPQTAHPEVNPPQANPEPPSERPSTSDAPPERAPSRTNSPRKKGRGKEVDDDDDLRSIRSGRTEDGGKPERNPSRATTPKRSKLSFVVPKEGGEEILPPERSEEQKMSLKSAEDRKRPVFAKLLAKSPKRESEKRDTVTSEQLSAVSGLRPDSPSNTSQR